MGVFDFVKQGTQAMCIARPEQYKQLLCYRHEGGNEGIPMFSQLTVNSDECAVFFKDGQRAAVLPPGRHTLHTQNIPILQPFISSFTGGNLFIAEIYFVKMVPLRNPAVNFGGQCGGVFDPYTSLEVDLRVFGSCAIVVTNPEAFIIGYHGQNAGVQDNAQQLKWVTGKLINSVGTVITNLCQKFSDDLALPADEIDPRKSVRRVLNNKDAVAAAFLQSVPDLDKIGIKICEIGEININLGDDSNAALKTAEGELADANRGVALARKKGAAAAAIKQAEIDQEIMRQKQMAQMAGGYDQFARGQMMMGAGAGMAAHGMGDGVAGMGAQMAMGVGMGNQFAAGMAAPMQPPPPQAPVYAPPSSTVSCPKCATKQPGGKFCAECGTTLAQQKKFCTGCGGELAAVAKFCAGCGTPATAIAGTPMAPAPAE